MKDKYFNVKNVLKGVILRTKKLKSTFSVSHPNTKYSLDLILDEIIYVLRNGISWRELRSEINYNTLFWHFNRFSKFGVFKRSFNIYKNKLIKKTNDIIIIDTTTISNKYGRDKIARNRYHKNKNCCKISAITDVRGIPLTILLDKGTNHDLRFIDKHVKQIRPRIKGKLVLLADKGYVSFKHRESLQKENIQLMAMKKKNMKSFGIFDKNTYKKRIFVEHYFQKLKRFKRVQIRYDSSAINYFSFVFLASCIIINNSN